MRYEMHNLDGRGQKRTRVYDMVPAPETLPGYREYWPAVTDVPCPAKGCTGNVQWAEAGHAPGYRICDACGRHYLAKGNAEAPTLVRVGSRRSNARERRQGI